MFRFLFQCLPCLYFLFFLVSPSFSIPHFSVVCVSVYKSDFSPSFLPSVSSFFLSLALFLPPLSSHSVTLGPCLIHWRFIGTQAELFCQAITVQNSMKAQFSESAFHLYPWPATFQCLKEPSFTFCPSVLLCFIFYHSIFFMSSSLCPFGYFSSYSRDYDSSLKLKANAPGRHQKCLILKIKNPPW